LIKVEGKLIVINELDNLAKAACMNPK
ncbi:MAG: hypothetical protein ACTILD_11515, partial [Pseudoalteromonas sp.]